MGDSVSQYENPDSPMVLLRRLHRWRMAFFGLVILLAGVMTGAAGALLVVGHARREGPLPPGPAVMELLAQIVPRLHLSREQIRQIEPILDKHMERLHEIQLKGRTEITEELKLMNEELVPVLNEDQARVWLRLQEGLPGPFRHGQFRHVPGPGGGFGPGSGGGFGPGPGRGFGPGPNRLSPPHVSPGGPPAPDANTTRNDLP